MSFSTLIALASHQKEQFSDYSLFSMLNNEDPAEHIKVGSFYEVDHSKLPHKSPDQLNKIRVVMVNEKTRMRVSLRFPSINYLRCYFNEIEAINYKKEMKTKKQQLPAFDEKYIIGSEVAAEALYRRISSQEIADKSNSWSFWMVKHPSVSPRKVSYPPNVNNIVGARKVSLMSDLNETGMVKWGQRRQARFLAKHVEDKLEIVTVSKDLIKDEEEKDGDASDDDTEEEEEGEEEVDVKLAVNKSGEAKRKLRKRKCQGGSGSSNLSPKKKRCKIGKKKQIVVYRQKKNKLIKNSIDRWSAERYKLAEENMLKVMKEQDAVFRSPILRPELRAEARKLIGDTGLLDHLLKHMSGKVAPGGEERFRRRHNADGAMEYWLEKADLVDIRKEAGVQDPYWTPPPGWKPGDNPSQDPVCARDIKELREEIAKIKGEMKAMVSKKQGEELATVAAPNYSPTSQDMEHDNLLIPLKEMYIDLVNKKVRMEEQLKEISESLYGMEEEMEKLKTRVEKSNRTESTERPALLMGSTESITAAGTGRKGKGVMHQEKEATALGELAQEQCKSSSGGFIAPGTESPAPSEDRAAKIERLKSGFTLCKPQGSFLWPDMTTLTPHSQVVVQLEDLITVHTPPSVSSTSPKQSRYLFAPPSQSHIPHRTSPVRPLAEKRPVTIPQSTASTTPITCPLLDQMTHFRYENNSISTSTTTTKTPLVNLNEPLNTNQTDDYGLFCESQSHAQAFPYPVTYQRRHHQNIAMPSLGPTKKGTMSRWEEGDRRKGMIRYCERCEQQRGCSSASSIASSSLPMGMGAWLALATSKASVEHKSKRG
ncbi:PROTEIN DYAD [Salix purpurea]|uniref:PROTEIN DYAD n=1 Tax=Salix purpurea TaxID=77065 RepID=A0A9Q0QFQ1_SALPP|nr:PROTEIN DYAD [Salix purpurea]